MMDKLLLLWEEDLPFVVSHRHVFNELKHSIIISMWGYKRKSVDGIVVDGAPTLGLKVPVADIVTLRIAFFKRLSAIHENHSTFEVHTLHMGKLFVHFSDDRCSVGQKLIDWRRLLDDSK